MTSRPHEDAELSRSLFNAMTEGVALHDLVFEDGRAIDYRIVDVNPAFEHHTGIAAEAARGHLASAVYGLESPLLSDYVGVVETGHAWSAEIFFEPMSRHFRIIAVKTGPSSFATIFEDITERIRTERALAKHVDALTASQEIGHLGNWSLDFMTGEFEASDEDYRIYGLEPGSEALLDLIWTLIHPDDLDRYREYVAAVQNEGRLGAIDYRIVRPDGSERYVQAITASVERGSDGTVKAASGITQDITERKRAEEELLRLYEQQRDIATVLQQGYLRTPPTHPRLDIGLVEVPVAQPALIGGDFWDVIELADGRIAVSIGDVAGKGVPAAVMTETLRSAMRAFAHIDPSPGFIVRNTNEVLLERSGDEQFVTALVATLDPRTGAVSVANAGHLPPILLTSDSCIELAAPHGPVLGVLAGEYAEVDLHLGEADCLVFYTDGVVEARRDKELFGENRLLDALSGLRGRGAQDVAVSVRDEALAFAGRLQDDLVVVALRLKRA